MPGDGSYKHNTDISSNAQDILQQVTREIEDALSTLNQMVETYKSKNEGRTIETYAEAQKTWNGGVLEMREALHMKAGALGDISSNYIDVDLVGTGLFG